MRSDVNFRRIIVPWNAENRETTVAAHVLTHPAPVMGYVVSV